MVFITIGSTHNNFDRLLKKVDELAASGVLEDIFVQTGSAGYTPKHYECVKFIDSQEYDQKIEEADFIICHAGDGTLNKCLAGRKKIIVVPRQKAFDEHLDDHQVELAEHLGKLNRVKTIINIEDLEGVIKNINRWQPTFNENPDNTLVLNVVKEFIENHMPGK